MTPDETDIELTARLAREAGRKLVELRERMWRGGAHSWDVMDGGDAASQHYLADQLRQHRPDDAVLSEEGLEDPRRFRSDRVWIIDPLDGTREFGEPGRHDWAVHVALWDRDHFVAAAVALPALDLVLTTDPASGYASRRTRPAAIDHVAQPRSVRGRHRRQRARLRRRPPRLGGCQGDGGRPR